VESVAGFFKGARLKAVGIWSFGPVDLNPDSPTFGYITSTPKLAWRNFDLTGEVRRALGVPVAMEQFVFHWVQVAGTDQSRLGASARDGLGSGTFLGVRQRDAQTSIRLLLGPLDARQFRDFLPDGKGGSDLSALMFDLLGPTMRVEVRLILRRSEVPPPRMGQPGGLSLGRNLWMFSTPPERDQSDAIYELNLNPA